ncbi:MAG TPA: ATP-binding protein [Candidatus Krumholzibacteria bacterium]|nr:ATP-binding protein [Candidatus Krumholzibacteria bacterium]
MRIEINFPSSHMFLGVPDAVIQEVGSELPFSQSELDELSTSVIEACTNAIEHGNELREDVLTRVDLEFSSERFEVTVWDNGDGFDFEARDLGVMPNDLMQERGRGLYMMNAFCDEIDFLRENGNFGVKLTKIPKNSDDDAPDDDDQG